MSSQSPPTPFDPGERIDQRYEVERELGSGGFGQVFLVRDRFNRDRRLALKVLRPPQGVSEGYEQRFLNEIEILRSLHHDGIPRILNDGRTSDGAIYFTMEFVDGVTLTSVLKELASKKQAFAPERMVRIVRRVLEILDYAHSRGVVHRDLKPGNIMLVRPGEPNEDVRVLDFGIAKVLRGASSGLELPNLTVAAGIGTPHYMAPEQVRSKDVDARADLYALGVILYQMCSGKLPFEGDSDLAIASARLEADPKPLAVDDPTPDWMRKLVFRLLERNRDKRPSSREILEQLVGRETPAADPRYALTRELADPAIASSKSAAPSSSLQRALIAFVTFAFIGAISFGAWFYFHRGDEPSTKHDGPSTSNDQAGASSKKNEPPNEAPLDSDGDGTPDERDLCPNDPNKTAPGLCGCGVPDTDTDGDGVPDCLDGCPNDPRKIAPGVCGCGVSDVDTDGDGTPDCLDECPNNPAKTVAGPEGCDPKPHPPIATLEWADVLDAAPDPGIVTDLDLLERIRASGLPWRVSHKATGIELLLVPSGKFECGARSDDLNARDDEQPAHEVTISKPFYLGRFEVTQAQWTHVMGGNPSRYANGDTFPVEQVSWNDINGPDGFVKRAGGDLRLPTESEWEFACRAGTRTIFEAGDTEDQLLDTGWYFRNSGKALLAASIHWEQERLVSEFECKPHAIGRKTPNRWGFSDMHGNVGEWCADWYAKDEYASRASGVVDSTGPTTGTARVVRGGTWLARARHCRSSARDYLAPDERWDFIGFRVARTP